MKKSDTRKVYEKSHFQKKNLTKSVRKSCEKTYDSLLADLAKHQTRIQKFVLKRTKS